MRQDNFSDPAFQGGAPVPDERENDRGKGAAERERHNLAGIGPDARLFAIAHLTFADVGAVCRIATEVPLADGRAPPDAA